MNPAKPNDHWIDPYLSEGQCELAKKHGTPAEFAAACYQAVPGDISMDEARAAIDKYNREWENSKCNS